MHVGPVRENTVRTMAPLLSPSHEIADHVSEIRLRVHAGSLGGLLEEAGRAVAQLEPRGADATRGTWGTTPRRNDGSAQTSSR